MACINVGTLWCFCILFKIIKYGFPKLDLCIYIYYVLHVYLNIFKV